MCGIVTVFRLKQPAETLRLTVLDMAKKLRHRGPDWSGIFASEKIIMAHERLAIVDPRSGRQPLFSPDKKQALAVNGEIYNHKLLRKRFADSYPFATQSDCEVILPLWLAQGPDFLNELNGIFAFTLYDAEQDRYIIARDHIGIIPLYVGYDAYGQHYAASELKALEGICNTIENFPPGHYYDSADGAYHQWYQPAWKDYTAVKYTKTNLAELRKSLEAAVHRQLMSDVPYGVLLSGGLDSSIIAAIAKKYASRRIESDDAAEAWWPQLHSFAIGLENAPDLKAAKMVAEHIGTIHHEISYTIQEGLDAIRDVIYHLETYDVTTVRASTPMYLLARFIKSMGVKMVLSGEGADEIFGGYLYFHKAPNTEAFHEETVRKVEQLHLYDCLRANKSLAAWGIEGRVPFLDREFIDLAMAINPADKKPGNGRIEKLILRQAFADLLPDALLWRQKEQFSDGVGYGWIDTLKKIAADSVSDEEMNAAAYRFPVNTPRTKEEYRYRAIFQEHFPSESAAKTVPSVPSVACSTAIALEWDRQFQINQDPSGRSVGTIHQAAKTDEGN
jgi:asparagine synthase (glutamine-hydrolysing)